MITADDVNILDADGPECFYGMIYQWFTLYRQHGLRYIFCQRFENLLQGGLVASQVQKDSELARKYFEEASATHPDNYLSFLYGFSVSPDPVMFLRKALELNPDSLKAWILLGEELAKRNKIKEAFECFNSAARIYPEYEIPLLRAASLLEKLGERSQAEKLFDRAAKLTIYHPPLREMCQFRQA